MPNAERPRTTMHERFHALATSAAEGPAPTASPPSTTERTGVLGGRRLQAPWSPAARTSPPPRAQVPVAPPSVWSDEAARPGPPPAVPVPATAPAPDDAPLLALLLAPALPGETAMQAFARKELELRTWFEPLTPVEALGLHRRLSNPQPADPVAMAFGRLVIERRHRLLAFLGDARRRAVLRATRRAA